MNRISKCDLSYNNVKLDYKALKDTAAIAVRGCVDRLNREEHQLHNALFSSDITLIHLTGERIKEVADSLAIATDVYAALVGGMDREEVEIINK